MYWKEKYKTRTVEGYEGSDTIYNNEPRVEFDELVDYMERFTELYKKVRDEHPSLREAICFDAQYPLMMLNIMPNDKFVGRADIFPLGFNAQYINNEWGFALDTEWFNEQIQNEQIPQSQRDRLAALKGFWKDETSNGRFTKNMDPVHYEFLWSGGPKAPEDSFETKPQAGFCGSRVAGIFLDYEKLLQYGLPGLIDLTREKEKTAEHKNPEFFQGIRMMLRTIMRTLLWYADQADELAEACTDRTRKLELRQMAHICRKLTVQKPSTFRDAIQLVIIYTIMDGAREWGRMDDYLANYYVHDLEAGILSLIHI